MNEEYRRELFSEAINCCDRIVELLHELNDTVLNAYCLADVEGQGAGRLGEGLRDRLERALLQIEESQPRKSSG